MMKEGGEERLARKSEQLEADNREEYVRGRDMVMVQGVKATLSEFACRSVWWLEKIQICFR